MGTKQAVAESWRNLTAVGAQPLAITDNLNYGNPERPEIMGQFVESIRGMAAACEALDYPVVAGNVSLYNETNGVAIPPTPAIGGVGLIADLGKVMDLALKFESELLVMVGCEEGHLGQSLYQQVIVGKLEGAPPPVDLNAEKHAGELVRQLIHDQKVSAVHDVSDGGLLVAITEMALAGDLGVELYNYEGKLPQHAIWFGEDQGRYVLSLAAEHTDDVIQMARASGIDARIVGRVGGDQIKLGDGRGVTLSDIRSAHEDWLPRYMAMP
jgi:phosphoribosylformylglycinamidine synthase